MFETLSQWGQKLARLVGDRTQFGVETEHADVPVLEHSLD